MLCRPSVRVTVTRAGRSRGATALIAGSSLICTLWRNAAIDRIFQRAVVECGKPGATAHRHHRGGMRQRIFGGEIIRRMRVPHHRGKTIGRDLDALDLIGMRAEFGQCRGEAIECRVDRVAARVEPEIVAGDLPDRAKFVQYPIGRKSVADEIGPTSLRSHWAAPSNPANASSGANAAANPLIPPATFSAVAPATALV